MLTAHKYIKRCSTSLIKEMQIKTGSNDLLPIRIAIIKMTRKNMLDRIDEDVQERTLFTRNLNWNSFYGRLHEVSSKKKKKFNIVLPYGPAIPLLGIYPKEPKI